LTGDFSLQSGTEAARRWLALEKRPTGVFCAIDQMACGFISELSKVGFSVPRDVSVVGFDDIEIGRHFIPALTTIHQPRRKIGAKAAAMLIDRINGEGSVAVSEEKFAVRLVRRQSAAPPL